MDNLYLIFFVIAIFLFAGIVGYSWLQQRDSQDEIDGLLDGSFDDAEADAIANSSTEGATSVSSASTQASKPTAQASKSKANVKTKVAALKKPLLDRLSPKKKGLSGKIAPTTRGSAPTSDKADRGGNASSKAGLDSNGSVGNESRNVIDPESEAAEVVQGTPKIDQQSSAMVTDLVARVKNPQPIEQRDLLSLFRKHDFKFHRKVHIYGLNQLTDLWRDIEFEQPSARFVELGVSIQLADRDGAMSKKELHDFQQMALEFTERYDAPFEFSMQIDEALKQAQLLDQIGRRYDSMAVLNVVPKAKSGFRMADIESCARDLMMSADKNGIFMKTQGQKNNLSVLFRLACTDGSGHFGVSANSMTAVHDLVVYMNVPATQNPETVFQEMVKDANSLATWLEGRVVDRSGRAMTQRSYSVLMQQISDIAFSMQQDGLEPGDTISKKLF